MDNVNIYVSDFKQKDIYDIDLHLETYGSVSNNLNLWFLSTRTTSVKAGDIVRITVAQGSEEYVDMSLFPVYLIAKRDYGGYPMDLQWPDYDRMGIIPIITIPYKIVDNKIIITIEDNDPQNIWDSCNPANVYGNDMPWTFETIGVVTDYIALQWADKYNDVGTFTLTVPANDDNISLFEPNRYIMINQSDKIMIVESIKFNNNLLSDGIVLQVSGRSLESVLDRRVAFPGMALDTDVCKSDNGLIYAIYNVIDAYFINPEVLAKESSDGNKFFYYPERRVTFMQIPDEDERPLYIQRAFNASVNKNLVKDNILDFVTETCQNNNLGYKILVEPMYGDTSKMYIWKFILYTGIDKSYNRKDKTVQPLIFSPVLNNVKSVATLKDSTNYKNVIFCGVERDSEGYINLMATENSVTNLLNINMPQTISNLKNKISNKLQKNPVTYTGIFFCAIAANRSDKDYTRTVAGFRFKNITAPTDVRDFLLNMGIQNSDVEEDRNLKVWKINAYPDRPITGGEAEKIEVIFYKTYGEEYGFSKTGSFFVSKIESDDPEVNGFKDSTQFGWFTPTILREATSAVNALPEADSWHDVPGIGNLVTKKGILAWFRTFDSYTSNSTTQKWLCQAYDRSNHLSGIDRKEVFVDQENEDDNDWDASAINAWRANTTLINTNTYDDEDSDEEVNKKLMQSARHQSGEFNLKREVDVDIEYDAFTYLEDYNLGDIVQVDDGCGNNDCYYISECTIANDTSNGLMIVPNFVKYDVIPNGYAELEYLRVSNMILPIKYCPQENLFNTDTSTNYGLSQPDLGPSKNLDNPAYAPRYKGYIDGIINERRSKWTEFEFKGGYLPYEKPEGQSTPLKKNFALISAVGYALYESGGTPNAPSKAYRELMPYALISSRIKHPLQLGGAADFGDYMDIYPENNPEGIGNRYFYQFIGDYKRGIPYRKWSETLGDYDNRMKYFASPGIGIKWNESASNIDRTDRGYLSVIYTISDDSEEHMFYLNKAVQHESSKVNEVQTGFGDLKYSRSFVDNENNILADRPQFQFAYPYGNISTYESYYPDGYNAFLQCPDWEYGHNGGSDYDNHPGNTYKNNPWNRLLTAIDDNIPHDATSLSCYTFNYDHHGEKYIFLNGEEIDYNEDDVEVPWNDDYLFLDSFSGVYGQITFNGSEEKIDMDRFLNGSDYRYVILGGYAKIYRSSVDSRTSISWDEPGNEFSYSDSNNGVYIKELKVYEYESSHRIYNYSKYYYDFSGMDPTLVSDVEAYQYNVPEIPWDNPDYEPPHEQHQPTSGEPYELFTGFYDSKSGSENVNIDSRRLVHDYVPVKYTDVGDKKPEDIEIYGLYDIIDNVFIPVNYCPDAVIFGETRNSHATFIDAGGEVPKY